MNLPPLRYRRRGKSTESAESCNHVVIVVSNSCQPQLEYLNSSGNHVICHGYLSFGKRNPGFTSIHATVQPSTHRGGV